MVVKFGSVEDGFNASEACAWFAEWLTEARLWVLVTGSLEDSSSFALTFMSTWSSGQYSMHCWFLCSGLRFSGLTDLGAVLIDVIQWL